ncbi:MAG: YicC family protein [Omnitrophica bacterium]|nr:YicC family protein [Candidatus Omnitrophota bacterium]
MIKSMTGYGKGKSIGKAGSVTVELRSLNHRYFDLIVRLPNHLCVFEDKVRDCLKKRLKRGRINLAAIWEGKEKAKAAFSLDLNLAKKYHREFSRLKRQLNLKDELRIEQIISRPEVITYEQNRERADKVWPHLKKALSLALENLERMRQAEGKRLMSDLLRRVKRVRYCLGNIETQLPKVIGRYRKNVLRKVKALSGIKKLDRDRIAEEVALFMRNSDVSEELTRIKSHLKGFKTALHKQTEVGKELDFIAQELFREANTIGAKASDFKISRWVIKMKSQIEKMREQLQNVE